MLPPPATALRAPCGRRVTSALEDLATSRRTYGCSMGLCTNHPRPHQKGQANNGPITAEALEVMRGLTAALAKLPKPNPPAE